MTLHLPVRPARRTVVLAAASLALAGSLTACGGGDSTADAPSASPSAAPSSSPSSETSSAAAISKDDFLSQGNAICAKGNAEIAAIGQSIDTTDASATLDAVQNQVVPNIQQQVGDLRSLGYPEGDEDTLSSIYDQADQLLEGLAQDASPLLSGAATFDDINSQLNDYGLTECGSDS